MRVFRAFHSVGNRVRSDTVYLLDADAVYGITDDLTVEAAPLSLRFRGDKVDYTAFRGAVTARFLRSPELDLGARFRFHVDNDAVLGFGAGARLAWSAIQGGIQAMGLP